MERKANNETQKSLSKVVINWYPGHMAKTKREIKESISLIDVVCELIDARIPYSSKNKDITNLVKDKPKLLVMTKMDLCDISKSEEYKKYYEDLGYQVIMTDLLNNKNINKIITTILELGKPMNDKRINMGMKKRKIRVLIAGVPNVGKSTLINRLVGKKAVNTGNKPGVTKQLSWIRINNDLELLDTPGILEPKLEDNEVGLNLASMTSIKEEILDKEEVCIHIIKKMLKLYPDNIIKRYDLKNINTDIVDILDQIGNKIKAYYNSEIDYDKVYNTVIKDLRDGYLGNITFDEKI